MKYQETQFRRDSVVAAVWTVGYVAMLCFYFSSKALNNKGFERLQHADHLMAGKEGIESKNFHHSRKSYYTDSLSSPELFHKNSPGQSTKVLAN